MMKKQYFVVYTGHQFGRLINGSCTVTTDRKSLTEEAIQSFKDDIQKFNEMSNCVILNVIKLARASK